MILEGDLHHRIMAPTSAGASASASASAAAPERISQCGDGDSGAATQEIGEWLQMRGSCADNAGKMRGRSGCRVGYSRRRPCWRGVKECTEGAQQAQRHMPECVGEYLGDVGGTGNARRLSLAGVRAQGYYSGNIRGVKPQPGTVTWVPTRRNTTLIDNGVCLERTG